MFHFSTVYRLCFLPALIVGIPQYPYLNNKTMQNSWLNYPKKVSPVYFCGNDVRILFREAKSIEDSPLSKSQNIGNLKEYLKSQCLSNSTGHCF